MEQGCWATAAGPLAVQPPTRDMAEDRAMAPPQLCVHKFQLFARATGLTLSVGDFSFPVSR
eukprot:1147821-Pelagomonas_calceolata.AAC.12